MALFKSLLFRRHDSAQLTVASLAAIELGQAQLAYPSSGFWRWNVAQVVNAYLIALGSLLPVAAWRPARAKSTFLAARCGARVSQIRPQ